MFYGISYRSPNASTFKHKILKGLKGVSAELTLFMNMANKPSHFKGEKVL